MVGTTATALPGCAMAPTRPSKRLYIDRAGHVIEVAIRDFGPAPRCAWCGRKFTAKRLSGLQRAETCSARCRQARHRARKEA